jgi:hypothetical protein
MPKFHDPAPYDFEEHTGYKQIFDTKSLDGWDADPSIWRVDNGVMVGETLEGKPRGNNYIVYRGEKARDFDLKLQMKIEKGGGGGIQYRSVTGVLWTRPQPPGQPPYELKFMMTGPQADFWFPVNAVTASYTGQWYSENTMQGILAYRGQVTQALPGQTNRLVANIGDKLALGGYVRVNEWNDYEVIARGGVGVPGKFCTSRDETNWYGRSLEWHEESGIRLSRGRWARIEWRESGAARG